MDSGAVSQLLDDDGRGLLASLPPYEEKNAVALTTRLRKAGHDPELIAAALTQSRLRARAVDKFGDAAASMFFTPDALEQATRAQVGALHAERLRSAGAELVIDGGCGIGSDASSFARAGLGVIGVETDVATAKLATANLEPWAATSRVEIGALEDLAPALRDEHPAAAWWFDPARRTPGVADIRGRTKRTFSLGALSPSWELVQELAADAPAAGAKLSPSIAHADIPAGCEAEFVSYAGDVVEGTIWWGDAVGDAGRSATIVRPRRRDGRIATSESAPDTMTLGVSGVRPGASLEGLPPVDVLQVRPADAAGADDARATRATLGAYFYEADKALTRSGLVGALLNAVNGCEFATGYGYITADAAHDVGLLGRGYRVVDAVPLHPKTFRSYLRERGVGRLTIKKRDVDVDADALRRSLKLKGDAELTVVLVDLDGERLALVVEPLAFS